jgi:hypothetical protein
MHAAELMQQPHGVLPHDDHFHVRIGCPSHQSGCVENPTVHVARSGSSLLAQLAHGHRTLASPAAHALVTPAPRRAAGASPTLTPLAPVPPPSDTGESEPDPTEPPALLSAPIDDVDG